MSEPIYTAEVRVESVRSFRDIEGQLKHTVAFVFEASANSFNIEFSEGTVDPAQLVAWLAAQEPIRLTLDEFPTLTPQY